jgi:hypothetical protein
MKYSNDTIGNRTRDLPICSAVPQPLRHRVHPVVDGPDVFIRQGFSAGDCRTVTCSTQLTANKVNFQGYERSFERELRFVGVAGPEFETRTHANRMYPSLGSP